MKKSKKKQISKNSTVTTSLQKDIATIKHDLKMVKIDVGLEKVGLGLNLRGLTREVERNRKELKEATSILTDMIHDVDGKIDQTAEAIRSESKQYHEEVITKLDSIAGELKTSREEQTVLAYRQSNHGERIEKLETAAFLVKPLSRPLQPFQNLLH